MATLSINIALRRFYASAFCMDGAFFLILAAIPFKVLDLGGGPVALGLVPAIGSLTYIIFTLLAGRWSDRVGRTWLCLTGNSTLILFAILAFQCHDLALLLLLMPLMGIGKALYWPVVQATVGDISGPAHLERNIGRFNVAWSLGKSFGFFATGLLLAEFGFRTTFLCGAGLVVLAFLFLPRGRIEAIAEAPGNGENTRNATVADSRATTLEKTISASRRRTFRYMAWTANLAAYGAAGVLSSHLPKWFTLNDWGEGRFGLFLALIFLVQTVTFLLLTGKIRYTYSTWRLWLPLALAGLTLFALPWFNSWGWYLVIAPILGVSFGISYAASIFYSLHTESGKGMNAGIHESLVGVGGFLPPLLGGLLARGSGWLGAPYLLAAAFIFLILAWQFRLWRFNRRRESSTLLVIALLFPVLGLTTTPVFAQKNWPPWLRDDAAPLEYPPILVTATWLAEHSEEPGITVLDVRDIAAYQRGHIPGAISISPDSLAYFSQTMNTSHLTDIANVIGAFGRWGIDARHQLICYGNQAAFGRAARLFWLLEVAGAREVKFLDGGWGAWQQAGLPVATDTNRLPVIPWAVPPDTTSLATARYIFEHFGRPVCEILDARASGFGETALAMSTVGSAWREGHIPHALPVDFLTMIQGDGILLAPEEIRSLIAGIGPRPHTYVKMQAEFIVYDDGVSDSGVRGYLMLRLSGIPQVRYYPGGWEDWCSHADLPFVRIIPAAELKEQLEANFTTLTTDTPLPNLVLFDVRHVLDYERGHIPGAVHIPAHQFSDSLATRLDRFWPDIDRAHTAAVVYCYGSDCIRSRNCATILAQAGFLEPGWFRGGMREWQNTEGAIVQSNEP